jgi:Ala-tRNA(Pro) deacylase
MVELDGEMPMAVLPASRHLGLDLLKQATGAERAGLAAESDFQKLFPSCELGAMPPFGNLWNLPVWMNQSLTDDPEIAFAAGTHSELVRLAREDYERVVEPRVARFAVSN